MNNKYYFILISLLYLSSIILAHRIHREVEHGSEAAATKPDMDDLDRSIINQTGCKFLSLAQGEQALFTKNSGLAHTTLASLLSDETLVDQNQTNFEMHFAIRSAPELHVSLFTRRQYVNTSRTHSDFEIGYGSQENRKSYLKYTSISDYGYGSSSYRDAHTNDILSVDKYAKLYIKLDYKELKLGYQCARSAFYSSDNLGYNALEFVQFGFLSKSEKGAKILYDCPSNFAGCPCKWTVY